MDIKKIVLVLIILVFLSSIVAAADENDCLYYFYGSDCPQCEQANAHLKELQSKYPGLKVEKLEVYQHFQNARTLQKYFNAHGIPENSQGVPAVFLPGSYLIGSTPIVNLLEGRIKENIDPTCPALDPSPWIGVVGDKAPHDVLKTLTFAGVTGSAVSDSFNPGMLAVLLILLTMITIIKDDIVMVKRTALFITSSFIAYLLMGFGMLSWFAHPTLYMLFYKVIGVVAVVVGVIKIRAFSRTWKLWRANVTEKTDRWIVKTKGFFTSPAGMILLGFSSSLLTSARLSKVFSILQSLLTEGEFRGAAVPLVLFYSVLLVLPLILVVAVLHLLRERQREFVLKHNENFSSDLKRAKWSRHNQLMFQLVISSAMVLVGLILLFV